MVDRNPLNVLLASRAKHLTHALILSVTLNIAFLATFFYVRLKEKHYENRGIRESNTSHQETFEPLSPSLANTLSHYLRVPFDELIENLSDETHIEQGQLACDLALACLVARHYFDYERALSGELVEKRDYAFQDKVSEKWVAVTLFTGLNGDKWRALREFARRELWPLTAEGLFLTLKRDQEEIPLSLKQTFFLSSEFYLIQRALTRQVPEWSRDQLLFLLLQGDWPLISTLARECAHWPGKKRLLFSKFCHELIDRKCREAAHLLLLIDSEYALKELDDEELEYVLSSLDHPTIDVENFLVEVMASLRSESMREKARLALIDLGMQTEGFASSLSEEEEKPTAVFSYIVQIGDTLWKISRQFDVSIDQLRKLNVLSSDVLVPGRRLLIPRARQEDR